MMEKIESKRRTIRMGVEKTLRLIGNIESQRCLWDRTDSGYKQKNAVEEAWKNVAAEMGIHPLDCSDKWKSLRAANRQYMSRIRRNINIRCSSDGGNVVKWPYFSALAFLKSVPKVEKKQPVSLPIKIIGNMHENEEERILNPRRSVLPHLDKSEANNHGTDRIELKPFTVTVMKTPEKDYDLDHSVSSEEPEIEEVNDTANETISLQQSLDEEYIEIVSEDVEVEVDETQSVVESAPTGHLEVATDHAYGMRLSEPEFVSIDVPPFIKHPPKAFSNTELNDPQMTRSTRDVLSYLRSSSISRDEDAVYGQSIALQMKQFSPRTKRKLQIEIHELIAQTQKRAFEKQFGHSYDSEC